MSVHNVAYTFYVAEVVYNKAIRNTNVLLFFAFI